MMKTKMTQWVPCAISSANIRNIYKEEELEESITCAKFAHMGTQRVISLALDLSLTRDSAESHFLCSYDKIMAFGLPLSQIPHTVATTLQRI